MESLSWTLILFTSVDEGAMMGEEQGRRVVVGVV